MADPGCSSQNGEQQRANSAAGFKSYTRIFSYADNVSTTLYALSCVAAIASGTALPFMDLIFGKFVNVFTDFGLGNFTPSQYMDQVSRFSLYFIYLFVVKFVLVYTYSVLISIAAIRTTKALRLHFLQSLLRQEMAFFDSKEGGSPSVKVTTNGNLVTNGISEKLAIAIQSISTFVAAFAIAFAVQWKLTLITLCIVPAIVIVTAICAAIDVKQDSKVTTIYAQAGLLAEEVFGSISTVHAFWLQPFMSKRYGQMLCEAKRAGMRKTINYGVLFSTEFFCVYAGYGLAFWQGIRMYARGEIEQPGSIVTVIFAVIVAATAMTQIAPQVLQITKAATAADELFRTVDRVSLIDAMSTEGLMPGSCTGNIEIHDLAFAYPSRPDNRVLNGLSLSIPAKKTTALVGASGSGKSTVIGLLERWYDQAAGVIYLDGRDIRELNLRWLRTNVRLVQQEPVLFSGTVFDNVAYGLTGTEYANAPREKQMELVRRACVDAFAHDFIENLPDQYMTRVGERARMLSGGQKQRVAIARSIVSNPPILLLDEATSALDPRAESIVQAALDNVSASRTTITIAHKLSTVQKAHNIAVMSNGVIVEQGTHLDLLAQDGVYARLVRAQDLERANKSKGDPVGASLDHLQADDISEIPELHEEPLSLLRTRSVVSTPKSQTGPVEQETKNSVGYGLMRCLCLLVAENTQLWHYFAILTVVCILGGATFPVQAILFARTFNVFQFQGIDAVDRGDFWALMFFVVAIVNCALYFTLGCVCNIIIQRITYRYRLELFENTIKQEVAFFDSDDNAAGAVVSRLSTCATNLQELLGINSGLILISVVNVVGSSILGIAYGWKLGLVCVFAALPPLIASGYLRVRLEVKLEDATTARFASSAALAAEAVSAIRTVASLTLEDTIMQQYEERLSTVARQSTRALVSNIFFYSLTQSANFLAMALGFWYGSKLVSEGEYTNEQFFVVFIAVIFGGEAAANFFQYTTSLAKATGAANYIFWLRRRIPVIPADDTAGEQDQDLGKSVDQPASIRCNALTFAYPSRPKTSVIAGIEVRVPAGSFVAFVGPSGCGKSTLISLLSRFYDPISGTITVNDRAITELGPRQHRRRLALVQQEPTLYQGSVRENVAMGLAESAEATDEQVTQACRDADILDFVRSLPEGLDTDVGGRGSQLSGGQRQRISIARALIRDPKILLLDEATSALDTESEKIVQGTLEAAAKVGKRSTVAVAHRLSTIRDADRIFVFQSGRIAEAGSHAQLLQRQGIYFEMCKGQALDQAV